LLNEWLLRIEDLNLLFWNCIDDYGESYGNGDNGVRWIIIALST